MKIRTKINIGFLTTFILVVAVIGFTIDLYATNLVKTNISSYLTSSNHARAEHIRTFLQDQKTTASILAAASVYRDFLTTPTTSSQYKLVKDKIDKRLVRTLAVDTQIAEAFILDTMGQVVASSDKTQEGKDKSTDPYFLNAQKQTYIKDIYFSQTTNALNYDVAAPVFDDNGTFLGVSVLRYLPNLFFSIIDNENGLGNTEENFLINRELFLISPARFLGTESILKQKIETQNARNCFDPAESAYVEKNGYSGVIKTFGSQVVQAKDYRNVDVIATHSYIPETGWCLITKGDIADLFSFRLTMLLVLLGILVTAGVVFFIVGLVVSKRITKPIRLLQDGTREIERGNLDISIDVHTQDEVEDLAVSFNTMASTVKQSRADIEKKVEEQTHELAKKANELEDQKSAILNILDDVKKEKETTELLAHDLEKFKLAVDNASDHVIITDKEGMMLYGNKAVEKITGYKAEEAIGKKAGALWKMPMPTEFYKEFWHTIKDEKKTFIGEIQNKRKNGEIYTAAISVSPILEENGDIRFFVGLERDVSKEKEVDRAKSEFISLASHQMRTPLTAINWYSEILLEEDSGKLNKKQKVYFDAIATAGKQMGDIIKSFLHILHLESGTIAVHPVVIDIVKNIRATIKESQFEIEKKKITVSENYQDALPPLTTDAEIVHVVLQNLITNAVKYAPDGGQVDVSLKKVAEGDMVGEKKVEKGALAVSVHNNGFSISVADHDKIFGKFFRSEAAKKWDPNGNGIGLYMSKKMVDLAKGDIWLESVEGQGVTFYLLLPLDAK